MQGNNSLYCVPIRRQFMLTPDHINRIKRNLTTLNYIQWNQVGMEIYFWWPYISPENAAKPQPKVVQAPPARPMGTPAVPPKS